ncbi:MAG TPA: phosphatidylserine decarboxylase [Pirellulales bacterium]|jgi:phosphatidylserine decarboxylase|nr:phosphatidylserine decarboxylase [Pirellulales bacterium]
MRAGDTTFERAVPEPLPGNIQSIQPGGGACYTLELAWGRWRRWYLRTFRSGYVRHMATLRHGDPAGCPLEVLDPRDLKYHRNQCDCYWDPADDPFRWRDHLWLARWGLGELVLMGVPLLVLTVLLAAIWWPLALLPGVVLVWLVSFFRDPARAVPNEPGVVVSPADGKVAEVTPLDYDEFVGGPAVRIGIFLSIFNVHINRSPLAARVIRLRYWPGKFLNALNPASAWQNENMWIGLEEEAPPYRRLIVRQIAGLFARRIVCDLRPGERLAAGAKFGMIKLGSRTELIVPAEGFKPAVGVGQHVAAGTTVIGRYAGTAYP